MRREGEGGARETSSPSPFGGSAGVSSVWNPGRLRLAAALESWAPCQIRPSPQTTSTFLLLIRDDPARQYPPYRVSHSGACAATESTISRSKRFEPKSRRQTEARGFESSRDTAEVLVLVLDRAYATIRDDQVAELSTEMERLFAMMAQNVVDDADMEDDRPKATLRMIARVGLQPVEGDHDKFEIFALNSRGRSMPPTEINGASRRILALSFVLALCNVSRTFAPLVADSLLNFMSGSVRTNTLKVTSETASQPILLLTGADLESEDEVRLASDYGGATYTLTGQWQHGDEPGDVVNLSDPRQVSVLCSCGPREYCDVCERHGQAGSPGWSRRPS